MTSNLVERPTSDPVASAFRRKAAGRWNLTGRLAPALTVALMIWTTPSAIAQTIPVEALVAEGQQLWDDALRFYAAALDRDPTRADLWVRVSDIHARLGRLEDCISALNAAAQAQPGDPELYARLSRAYASIDRPKPALAAMQGAIALAPEHAGYLKAAGELAAWSGDYRAAREAYRRVIAIRPDDPETLLALARVSAWDGETDEAVSAYRQYLERAPGDAPAWLEAARAESWRGNDAGALELLQRHGLLHGESQAYRRELASVLTRARQPRKALDVLRPLLAASPVDYDVNWQHALAQTAYGDQREAERAFGVVSLTGPERPETEGLARQLRSAFGSLAQPSATAYGDSDGLHSYRIPLALSLSVAPGVRVLAAYERHELTARAGSGLERIDGGRYEALHRSWIGGELRPWAPLIIRASAGRHDSSVRREWSYSAGLTAYPSDAFRVDYDHEHSLMAISPRAVSLGILRDVDRLRLGWAPTVSFAFEIDASREALSDSNERWTFRAAPRFAVVRNQWLNLDAGVSASLFGARHDLSNGYYDPRLYQAYSLILLPYFKFSENHGLSVFVEAGLQRDESQRSFEPGGSVVAEFTLGIYRAWMLKLNGGATMNARLESGAFRGVSSAVLLTRRF